MLDECVLSVDGTGLYIDILYVNILYIDNSVLALACRGYPKPGQNKDAPDPASCVWLWEGDCSVFLSHFTPAWQREPEFPRLRFREMGGGEIIPRFGDKSVFPGRWAAPGLC